MVEDSLILEAAPRSRARKHIVDTLIVERAPKLSRSPIWPVLRPFLYALLDYDKAKWFADAVGACDGRGALELASELLKIKVEVTGLDRIPATGRVVMVSNHPASVTDGLAVWDAIKGRRPDMMFYINADALRVVPRMSDVVIPVEWMPHKRTRQHSRETLQRTREAMEAERALMIFPAGQLAERSKTGELADTPWAPGAFSIARSFNAPIAPMYLSGPWSKLFHFFNEFSEELRDVTLFHEMLNKAGAEFRLTIGPLIPAGTLPGEAAVVAPAVKAYVEKVLPYTPDQPFVFQRG